MLEKCIRFYNKETKKATRVSKRLEGGEQMRLEKKATMENAKELRIEAMEKDAILGKNAERILKI